MTELASNKMKNISYLIIEDKGIYDFLFYFEKGKETEKTLKEIIKAIKIIYGVDINTNYKYNFETMTLLYLRYFDGRLIDHAIYEDKEKINGWTNC